jgi:hypothetical protein
VTAWLSLATAASFVWLGMVLAISFLEAPLKFRAPGVTRQIGLSIGRLVFRALNSAELLLASVLASAVVIEMPTARIVLVAITPIVALAVQIALIRPSLGRRSDRVLASENVPRSQGHYWYVGLECVQVAALLAPGLMLLTA